ncbi:MAG: right-handed parallel beta-helix repeat-containing protein, partial [Deltaproteobacteria bacterium]|nr:right-handed parallel beta-helix repeat-containing protein [Deltaproteobacteria bacterium]
MKQGYAIRTIARTLTLCFLFIPQIALGRTFYVDGTNGNDTYSSTGAQNPATPWKTIKKAMGAAMPGDTVSVKGPYTYNESIESKRDGTATAPITLMADTPGTVTVDPPPFKNGFFITHDHHVIDGFIVTGATVGVKIGPHDAGNGPVTGVIVRNCQVTGNSSNGIQLTNAIGGVVEDSTVSQNGRNGIFYSSGQDGQIHDNVVNANAQFGIYVRSGTGYQVWNNTATGNGRGNIKIVGSTSPPPGTGQTGQRIFYVSATTGDDARDEIQAQNSSTPWKTIGRALQTAIAGETVIVLPGSYNEHVQSRRDGISNAPITIKAAEPGTVTITPPSGFPGIYIGHHYHVVEGLIVIGSTKDGIQMGPYGTAGNPPVNGPVARNNIVCNNNLTGIKFSNAVNGTAAHNVVCRNAKDGIWYSGNGANIFNNLVYGNGTSRTGDYGITLYSGSGHQVTNNTVYSNLNGGVRLALND